MVTVVCVLMLSGCVSREPMDRALQFRQSLLDANGCSFRAEITADYGDYLQTFILDCQAEGTGRMRFTVVAPDAISGITGTLSGEGNALTFDDQVLAFPSLADGQLAPVTAPWVLLEALRGGYLRSCAESEGFLLLSVDDSYEADALGLDIRLDGENHPVSGEFLWNGRRILSIKVENFELLLDSGIG